jgi:hypothetical protein
VDASLAAAQTADTMAKPMPMAKAYTGCVAAGSMTGTFMLNHAMAEMAMNHDTMAKDSMKKDAMAKDSMAKDSMGKEMSMAIESKSVDLSKLVGHKVYITGADAPMGMAKPDAMSKSTPMFAVSSVKMIATNCGM